MKGLNRGVIIGHGNRVKFKDLIGCDHVSRYSWRSRDGEPHNTRERGGAETLY